MKFRIFMISILFFFSFLVILGRAYQLQVLEKVYLSKIADQQRRKAVIIQSPRGILYDRNGEELAASSEVESLYCEPPKIRDPLGVAKRLSHVLKVDINILARKLSADKGFVWIKRKVTPEQATQVKKMNIEGIGVLKEQRRFYPNLELAGHVLGFAGQDSQGLEGLELKYDEILRGTAEKMVIEKDALGRPFTIQLSASKGRLRGHNLILTINRSIQYMVEQHLKGAIKRYQAKSGMAIVMDPLRGEVLAMANYPEFNPNTFWTFSPSQWRNRCITDTFEPGSTFKAFLIASVLEERLFKPSDIFFCENGSYSLWDKTIHDTKRYGWLSLKGIIRVSSNIGASKIGLELGKERFFRYIQRFGFGKRVGIDLPGEATGIVRPLERWTPIDLATISFGQGISVTAIQLITAFSAIGNGGLLMKPYVVKEITDSYGHSVEKRGPVIVRRVLSERVAKEMVSIFKGVVSEKGTGKLAMIPGFSVVGKTGTAQKVDLIKGGYTEDKYLSSFIGFLPAEDPKVAILVVIDEPAGNPYGGTIAAPLFKEIAEGCLRILGIFPRNQMVTQAKISLR